MIETIVGMAINPSRIAPVNAVRPVGRSKVRLQEWNQHQDARKPKYDRRQAGQDFDQRLEDFFDPCGAISEI